MPSPGSLAGLPEYGSALSGEGMETPEEYEKEVEGYVEAVEYFMDHPDAPLDPICRAIVNSIKKDVENAREA